MIQTYILIALFVGFLWGLSPVINKSLLNKYSPISLLIISSVFYFSCAIVYFCNNSELVIRDFNKISHLDMFIVAINAIVGSFFANILYLYVLQKQDCYIISALINTSPLFTLILAYLLLKEKVRFYGILGIFLIVLGTICLAYNNNLPTKFMSD